MDPRCQAGDYGRQESGGIALTAGVRGRGQPCDEPGRLYLNPVPHPLPLSLPHLPSGRMLPSDFFLPSLFLLSYILPSVHSAFTYQFGVPGSCDDLGISWTGPSPLLTPTQP